MAARYDIKPDANGWTVYDTITYRQRKLTGAFKLGFSLMTPTTSLTC